MKASDKHAIVIGGGLGGLSAAIHLQRNGIACTLLEKNERVGGRAGRLETEGFTFDTGPSLLNYPWVFEELFESVDKKMEDYVRLVPIDPSITFHWPDRTTFTLTSHIVQLLKECEKVEPGVAPQLFRFLGDAECKYRLSFDNLVRRNEDNPLKWILGLKPRQICRLGIWHSLNTELGRFFKSRYLREAFGSYAMYLGGSPWELPGLFSILPYGELAYGLWFPQGGIYSMVTAIERLATELGVKIRTQAEVHAITTNHGAVTGVELKNGENMHAPIVVSNVDVPQTRATLLKRSEYRMPRPPRMTPGVVTIYWGIRHRETGLPHHSIFLPDNSRAGFSRLLNDNALPDELSFYTCLASEADSSLAPEGCSSVFVLVPVPTASEWEDEAAVVYMIKKRVLERLRHHHAALTADDIVFERVWTPMDWGERFGLFDGSAFGAGHRLFELGPFRSRNHDNQLKGLYYVGAGTTPGTGLPMVVLGGKMTADRICSHVL